MKQPSFPLAVTAAALSLALVACGDNGGAQDAAIVDAALDDAAAIDAAAVDAAAIDATATDGSPPDAWVPGPDPTTICSAHRWCWSHPRPTGSHLLAAWVGPGGERVVGGLAGVVLIDTGDGFESLTCGLGRHEIHAFWGESLTGLLAVGAGVFRFDGSCWHEEVGYSATGLLNAIWGASATDVFAVGTDVILHFDGESWQTMAPAPFLLYAVWGSGPGDVYAGGRDYYGDQVPVLHYDGEDWSFLSGGPISVEAIWGSAADDIYFAGTGGLYHFDSSDWTVAIDTEVGIFALWGSAADDIYAAGEEIFYFDGDGWSSELAIPSFAMAIAGGGGQLPITVGLEGYIAEREIAGWSRRDTRISHHYVHDIWGSSATDFYAVGDQGSVLHFDGEEWAAMETGIDQSIQAIWGFGDDDIYAVAWGGSLLHFDGDEWTATAVAEWQGKLPNALWGRSGDDLYAGVDGQLQHFDGEGWSSLTSVANGNVRDIWGWDDGTIWAVTAEDGVLTNQGGSWHTINMPTSAQLHAITGSSPDSIYVVAGDETVIHFDGESWEVEWSNSGGGSLRGVWLSGPDDVWAGGIGRMLHFDGDGWTKSTVPGGFNVRALWGSGPGAAIAGDASGGIIVHHPE